MTQVRLIFLDRWDPCGVGENPNLTDEHDRYVSWIVARARIGLEVADIATYLAETELGEIGTEPNPGKIRMVATAIARIFDAPSIAEVAIRLGVEVVTELDVRRRHERPENDYFVHGTSTGIWRESSSIDITKGKPNIDFGLGFYTFRWDARGLVAAIERAIQKQESEDGGSGFVLVTGIEKAEKTALSKLDFNEFPLADYVAYVNRNCGGGGDLLAENDLIVGPLARKDAAGVWVPNRRYPDQYVFKTKAAGLKLFPVLMIPAFAGDIR